jgi:predicted nucleotidyltransferase
MLKDIFQEIKTILQKEVESYYADRLVSIVFFGSAARGTQNNNSDVDLLIVAEDLPSGRLKRVKEFEIIL